MKLYELTISEARKGLQEKKFSSSELTGACLERIRAVEPKLHAFVTLTEEQALEQARKADFLLGSGAASSTPTLRFTAGSPASMTSGRSALSCATNRWPSWVRSWANRARR